MRFSFLNRRRCSGFAVTTAGVTNTPNQIEKETFYDFHIHLATERYQGIGAREDAYARPTDRYGTIFGAVDCMMADANVSAPPKAQGDLFDLEENI